MANSVCKMEEMLCYYQQLFGCYWILLKVVEGKTETKS